jgi:hypothetical protein
MVEENIQGEKSQLSSLSKKILSNAEDIVDGGDTVEGATGRKNPRQPASTDHAASDHRADTTKATTHS